LMAPLMRELTHRPTRQWSSATAAGVAVTAAGAEPQAQSVQAAITAPVTAAMPRERCRVIRVLRVPPKQGCLAEPL
jgi:hypothetical protein